MNNRLFFIILLGLCILAGLLAGCLGGTITHAASSSSLPSDPETAIRAWVNAVNAKDTDTLYALSPEIFRNSVALERFKQGSLQNPMLQPGFVFTSYHITNKTIDGNNATMMVDLFFHLQNATTGEQEGNITADFGFSYETGGWRIWQIPDPETAVAEWIDAVNVRNLNRLYLLSPAQFRKTISWNQFKTANENNSRLQPGYSYTGFSVLDKNVSGESATMRVLIQVQQSSPENSTIMQSFSTMEHFGFTFEDGEWKIWELPW